MNILFAKLPLGINLHTVNIITISMFFFSIIKLQNSFFQINLPYL